MKTVVIKLGGSLLSKSDELLFNYEYLDKLRTVLDKFIAQDFKFVINVGGGYLCRKFQNIARENGNYQDVDLHWIGIAAINMNADMLRGYWNDISEDYVIRYKDFTDIKTVELKKPVLVCAAENPGHSSDLDAVLMTQKINSKEIIRLTDVDAIYDSDPNKNPNAKKMDSITWDEYFDIIGVKDHFDPGGHYPIDPIASKMAQENGVGFFVMGGHDFESLENALQGKSFKGTVVK